jgi:hypothetical protein
MPQVPGWIPWIVFFGLNASLSRFVGDAFAFILAVVIAWSIPSIVRLPFRAKSAEEKQEEEFFRSIRLLRRHASEGTIRKKVPRPVLMALERCAGARVAAMAQLAAADPVTQAVEAENIEGCMRAALLAAAPVARGDEQGRREWDALCENQAVLGAMVDAIQALEDRMTRPSIAFSERLAALRELEGMPVESDLSTSA